MRIAVTGSEGFIGKNLVVRLLEKHFDVVPLPHTTAECDLAALLHDADAIVHLAGVNRTEDTLQFNAGNAEFTEKLCKALETVGRPLPLIYASSVQAEADNAYGRSKKKAEEILERCAQQSVAPLAIYRLPNVFGKWARPNYNSAVATFCHNVARNLAIEVHDPNAIIRLVHVDDVIDEWLYWLSAPNSGIQRPAVLPEYESTVGALAETILSFRAIREDHTVGNVGKGLTRALYATYISYLPVSQFTYPLTLHGDPRGVFVEFLRTDSSGQFSYFTAHPGVTRGGHYHHAKTEKFLVLKGHARFRFKNILSGEMTSLETSGIEPVVVQTSPGWTHDITNIGEDEMYVMLWANEVFDRARPDTIASEFVS